MAGTGGVAHGVLPQNHVQLLRVGVVGVAEVHLHAVFGAGGVLVVGGVDEVVVAVGVVGSVGGLVAGAGEQGGNQRAEARRCCSWAAGRAASPWCGSR